jgi:hypothetical protein
MGGVEVSKQEIENQETFLWLCLLPCECNTHTCRQVTWASMWGLWASNWG